MPQELDFTQMMLVAKNCLPMQDMRAVGLIPGLQRSLGEENGYPLQWVSLIAQLVNNLSAMQETRVQFLGREDPREKEMATHSGILAWRIPWTEKPVRLQSMGSQRVRYN